jgi:Sulfotransferase family
MARVRISSVTFPPLDPSRFRGGNLDHPCEGAECESYSVVLDGWVLHRIARPRVELRADGELVASVPVDRRRPDVAGCYPDVAESELSGFSAILHTLDLPRAFELQVDVLAEGAGRATLAVVRGGRAALPAREDGPWPIRVTSLGRMGTTYLMLLLASHPEVLVVPPFPFETGAGAYWASVLDALARPESYLQQVASDQRGRFWWLGDPGFSVETYLEPGGPAHWLGGEGVDSLAAFAAARIQSVYQALARDMGKPRACCFAEKQTPQAHWRRPLAELFPRLREIVLVRDLRDMVCSILAFNAKRGHVSFQRELFSSDEDFIRAQRDPALALLQAWRADGALRVRYEELVLHPRPTLRSLLVALGLDSSEGVLDDILARAPSIEPSDQQEHKTSAGPRESIGRWKRDLSRAQARLCEEALGDLLTAFGYPLEGEA